MSGSVAGSVAGPAAGPAATLACLLVAGLFTAGGAQAQSAPAVPAATVALEAGAAAAAVDPPASSPPPGAAGPWQTVWRHALVAGYNDNLSLLPAGALGSGFVALLPAWQATRESRTWRVQLNAKAELLRYGSRSEFNTDNSELSVDGLHALAGQRAAAWRVTLQDWHDPVGTSSLARPDGEPDHFVAAAGGAVLRQDLDGGRQRLEAELSASRKQYQNHRAVTQLGDVATQGAVLRWQPLSATDLRWLNEVRWVQAHHPFQLAALDHSDLRVTTGWQVERAAEASPPDGPTADGTGAARGLLADQFQIRLGLQRLRFDRLRPETLDPLWDLQARWNLSPGQAFELGAGRQHGVAPGDGADSVSTRQWRSTWVWDPTPDWRATVGWSGTVLRYVYGGFADGLPRTDRSQTLETSLRHVSPSGLTWTLSHARSLRRSSEAEFEFARRLTTISLEWPV